MVGRTLGHYEILEQIGSGGMGVVYRARDQHLERDVVLKLIPAERLGDATARERFRHEALALSRLNHPNIATVHDFDTQAGVDFLVLEHIEGETLDARVAAGRLPEREVLRLGVQLAAGLEAAHANGVVHRDLKPGNLRVTRDGRLKILDFGLARLLESDPARTQLRSLTQDHAIVGTLPYLAPEQLAGQDADARSDVYAAGAVLYELVSGQRAFPQRVPSEIMFAITNSAPRPLASVAAGISPQLEDVIRKALEKDPEMRYQSARELRVDLERAVRRSATVAAPAERRPVRRVHGRLPLLAVAAALAAVAVIAWVTGTGHWRDRLGLGAFPDAINSLAVLPLDNLTRDPDQEYFADGMTDELITCLGKISALRVTARGSVMEYKGTKRSLPEIARALRVAALLEGSVLRSQDHVRITARLIQAATGKMLWSESYERNLSDVLALQNEVAVAIASAIRIQLTPKEQAKFAEAHRVDPAAHEAFLLGQYEMNHSSKEANRRAVEQFKRAITIDPGYALAHAQLGAAYLLGSNWWLPPDVALPLARAAARKALEIDPDQPDARAVLGYIEAAYGFDFPNAEKDLRRAVADGPNSATAHQYLAYFLTEIGKFEEARSEYRLARQLDPLATYLHWLGTWPDFYEGRYDRVTSELKDLLSGAPDFADGYTLLGETYEQQGELAGALVQLRRAEGLGTHAWALAAIGRVQAKLGHRDSALAVIAELRHRSKTGSQYVTPYGTAMVYAALGDRDRAFEWLEKAMHDRSEDLVLLRVDPRMSTLRSDPRFAELLRRIGFPAS